MDLTNLSEAVPDAATATVKAKAAPVEEKPYEPKVHGESTYDRVSSMLISVVIGTAIIVGWLWLVYFANQAIGRDTPAALEIIEVYGGGGDPAGELGGTGENVSVAGAEAGAQASNNMEDAGSFEEPAAQETSSPTLDAFASNDSEGEVSDAATEMRGGAVASGRRASKLGNGIMGLGPGGPGDGGVGRGQRWVFIAPQGQSADDYARQLDFFGVELGTFEGSNTVKYASNFTGTPISRTGLSGQEKRLYVSWQGQARKQFDIELMRKAGIDVAGRPILQFLPDKVVQSIAQLEVRYKGRQPGEIAQTRFTVQGSGRNFAFVVLEQKSLRAN